MSILDDVPDIIYDATADLVFYDAVVKRTGPSTGPSHNPTPGAVQSYPCKALETTWSTSVRSGGLVNSADRKILILAKGLPVVPQEGDVVQIKGAQFRVVSDGGSQPAVISDPARATWTCRGRA